MSDIYAYVIFGLAALLGAVATGLVGLVLSRRSSLYLDLAPRWALAIAAGILVVGFFSSAVGYALFHRMYLPATGMDETGAAVLFLVSLIYGSVSASIFGVAAGVWERQRKK